jgi:glycosyltransferase involved in cell wall biosynthesis
VPSIWPEPFGRVVLEAQMNGIPVISSAKGGLPEAVGNGGEIIEDLYNINEWEKRINLIEKNHSRYSKNAKIHAKNYVLKKQMGRFEKFLKRVMSE